MGRRLDLHDILKTILGSDNVYFQPPASKQMVYPCIVYARDLRHTDFADNGPYRNTKRYQVTVIDRDPDSEIPDKVALLEMCAFAQYFATEGLNHDVFSIYF